MTAIVNKKIEEAPKSVNDIVFLNLSARSSAIPTFGFMYIMNRMICFFPHSLNSNPNIVTNRYHHHHGGGFKIYFLLYRLRLVLKAA